MGFQRAKSKDELNYRKALRSDIGCCGTCKHRQVVPIHGIGGELRHWDDRCEPIGMGDSKRYSVGGKNICDAYA